MDPASMILAFMLKNPQATTALVEEYNRPVSVDTAQLKSSMADFAMETLACYHKSAKFRGVDILGSPWNQQAKFGADSSVVIRIHLQGFTGTEYQMIVAAMAKDSSYRTFVLQENTIVPYNKKCSLERWMTSESSLATNSQD
ncbi:hypothetical protein HQ393_15690 [Chitinibacter bivalviorum]|uniref:Uncharacterized protein n=1 Tax=Chitinibacter bivalviorum TaxID=2739434 RepID=A0A7H9BLV3_9NEIS|nr:hypothetical protein [Chitinibacter bivalviorum]QLG89573.1 hypothetical protein HQ393_15690 [Chitinibacter bivalviorum]